ncbi:RimK family alpha-L-glutamate ligase [Acidisphaera sp. S103]|uniref:ATP-grasp domain-containing protein n=1 Tax=Acidisphaera sp. S103 TaxID=1747223 RepID=UPI00131B1B7D|nr:ATP-grasp domain-containing protein [Acidisphaera sp. S103]
MRIGLAIDTEDWHARRLMRAFAARGITVVPFRLSDAAFDTGHPHGLALPGFDDGLPNAVLVRSISGGSFEEVTRRLGVLHALREQGVLVWNDARAIERCVDKSTTSFFLAHAGIATPPTWAVEGQAAALKVADRECPTGPLVLKPLFGSQGRGLRLITTGADLPPPEIVGGVYYLQRYIPTGTGTFHDHRLFVCAGSVVAAMTRQAETWVTNVRQGAQTLPFQPDSRMTDLAIRAASCVGAAYAGVDILVDGDGRPWVLEVNSMPGWKGLQRVTATSVAGHIAAGLLAALR